MGCWPDNSHSHPLLLWKGAIRDLRQGFSAGPLSDSHLTDVETEAAGGVWWLPGEPRCGGRRSAWGMLGKRRRTGCAQLQEGRGRRALGQEAPGPNCHRSAVPCPVEGY